MPTLDALDNGGGFGLGFMQGFVPGASLMAAPPGTSKQPQSTGPNLDRRGRPQPGREFTFRDANGKEVKIRDDSKGHDYGPGDPQNRRPHFNDPNGNHYDY